MNNLVTSVGCLSWAMVLSEMSRHLPMAHASLSEAQWLVIPPANVAATMLFIFPLLGSSDWADETVMHAFNWSHILGSMYPLTDSFHSPVGHLDTVRYVHSWFCMFGRWRIGFQLMSVCLVKAVISVSLKSLIMHVYLTSDCVIEYLDVSHDRTMLTQGPFGCVGLVKCTNKLFLGPCQVHPCIFPGHVTSMNGHFGSWSCSSSSVPLILHPPFSKRQFSYSSCRCVFIHSSAMMFLVDITGSRHDGQTFTFW